MTPYIIFSIVILGKGSTSPPCPTTQTSKNFEIEKISGNFFTVRQVGYDHLLLATTLVMNSEVFSTSESMPLNNLYYDCPEPILVEGNYLNVFQKIEGFGDIFPVCEFASRGDLSKILANRYLSVPIEIGNEDFLELDLNKLRSKINFSKLGRAGAKLNNIFEQDSENSSKSACFVIERSIKISENLFKQDGVIMLPVGDLQFSYPQSPETSSERKVVFALFKDLMNQIIEALKFGYVLKITKDSCLYDLKRLKVFCLLMEPSRSQYLTFIHEFDLFFASMNLFSTDRNSLNYKANQLFGRLLYVQPVDNPEDRVVLPSDEDRSAQTEVLEKFFEILQKIFELSILNYPKAKTSLAALVSTLENRRETSVGQLHSLGESLGLYEAKHIGPQSLRYQTRSDREDLEDDFVIRTRERDERIPFPRVLYVGVGGLMLFTAGVFIWLRMSGR